MDETIAADQQYILPGIEGINAPDSIYTFLAESGFSHQFASGTRIHIPEDALVNRTGLRVRGEVQLHFKEYRDAIDLLVEGLQFNPGMKLSKTAGAFKIEVRQLNQMLFFDPSQDINIRQATYEKDEDYTLYYFDRKEEALDSLLIVSPEINEAHVQLERQIKRMKPKMKFPLNEDYFSFNYKGILDVMYNKDFVNVNHKLTQRKMEQYGLRWSNINVEAFINHNDKREFAALMLWRNLSRKPLPNWTKGARGRMEVINKNRYRLVVTDKDSTKTFSTQLEAVMPLRDLFDLGPGYWKKDYAIRINKIQSATEKLALMASAFRSFSINKFGIFGWQKISDEEESVFINAIFKYPDTLAYDPNEAACYYLSGDNKGIIYYPKSKWPRFEFILDSRARIFSIGPDRQIFYFPVHYLANIEFEHLQKMDSPAFIFEMEPATGKPESVTALRQLLNSVP